MNEISENARKLKNEYQKNWKRQNPDKVRASQVRYWERKAAQLENGSALDRAIQQNTVTDISVTPVTDKEINVTCLQCGKEFTPKRNDAKFCSPSCRVAFNRKKQ